MNTRTDRSQLLSETEFRPNEHEDERPDYIVSHLARLGILGLPDETYVGTSQGLLERLDYPSDNS